jgi:hypothetical protein
MEDVAAQRQEARAVADPDVRAAPEDDAYGGAAVLLTARLDSVCPGGDDGHAEEVRVMDARRLRRLATLVLTATVLLPAMLASAEQMASRADDTGLSRRADLVRVHEALSGAEVAKALAAQGLSAGEVERRLAQLSAEDLDRLAANLEQIQAAGSVPDYVWILLAAFLAVSSLAIIF